MAQWIQVEQNLPPDGELVIYWQPAWKLWECGVYRAEEQVFESEVTFGWDDEHHYYSIHEVTHWMPQSAITLPRGVGTEVKP